MYNRIGLIGAGNMGSAVARAIASSGFPGEILIANRTPAKAKNLAMDLGKNARVSTNEEVAASCDMIFLGVKPQMLAEMLEGIKDILAKREDRFILASMIAGTSMDKIQELAGGDYPVIRFMPNTPASIGIGAVQYCGRAVTKEEADDFAELIADAGMVDPLQEKLIDAASAVSGCGPAFVYMFIEAMADAGVACGLPRDKAVNYAAQCVAGSACMVLQTEQHPGQLKDAVCSPGGTTIQGVRALENHGFRGAVMEAVIAAYEKTKGLNG